MYRKTNSKHHHDPHFLDSYYLKQVGSGLPYYSGSTGLQRGYGLGGLLGGLFRSAMPLLKKGVAAVGKQALQTGMEIVGDVAGGQNIKRVAKKRVSQAGKKMGAQLAQRMQKEAKSRGSTTRKRSGIKRKAVAQNVRLASNKRRRKTYNDIFV